VSLSGRGFLPERQQKPESKGDHGSADPEGGAVASGDVKDVSRKNRPQTTPDGAGKNDDIHKNQVQGQRLRAS